MSLISMAYAQSETAAMGASGGAASFIPLVLIVAVFYFMIIRPQQRRLKEHQNLIESLRRGDKVVTSGGLVGTVKKVDNDNDMLDVEIADDVIVRVVRSTIGSVLNRSTAPAVEDNGDSKPKKAANNNAKKKAS